MYALLSVVIPAHNEERTICKTIDSLLLQDYSPFEIIVVDDGSTDHTTEILVDHYFLGSLTIPFQNVLFESKRIIRVWNVRCNNVQLYLVEKENGGKSDALNAGICFCHGEYFVCIDADCILPDNVLTCLTGKLRRPRKAVAVGGAVTPTSGIQAIFDFKKLDVGSVLQSCQELEYGIAFNIVRPIFGHTNTTMLISGALGVFRKDLVIEIGGYALDTVGEDMELVMRIRQHSADRHRTLAIEYTKEAACCTELPWKIPDWIKQRTRWTVGLSEALWRYRDVAIQKKYRLKEKIAFWYYVIFEKFSPHIELTSLVLYVCCGRTLIGLIQITVVAIFQIALSLIGSFDSIKKAIRTSDKKFRAVVRIGLLIIFFVTAYHYVHLFVRLIAVPYYRIKKRKSKDKNAVWTSPARR